MKWSKLGWEWLVGKWESPLPALIQCFETHQCSLTLSTDAASGQCPWPPAAYPDGFLVTLGLNISSLLGLCPGSNVALQGRQGSRVCIPDSSGESVLTSRGRILYHWATWESPKYPLPGDIWQCLMKCLVITTEGRILFSFAGRGQGWSWTSYNSQVSPHNKEFSGPEYQ